MKDEVIEGAAVVVPQPIFKTKRIIVSVPVVSGTIIPFKYKIPAEFELIDGFIVTHNHDFNFTNPAQQPPQIGNLSVSINNRSNNPINMPIIDNNNLSTERLARKYSWLKLEEETFQGEYIEGIYEDFGIAADFVLKLYFKGKIAYRH